jgi:hypothetical protein
MISVKADFGVSLVIGEGAAAEEFSRDVSQITMQTPKSGKVMLVVIHPELSRSNDSKSDSASNFDNRTSDVCGSLETAQIEIPLDMATFRCEK